MKYRFFFTFLIVILFAKLSNAQETPLEMIYIEGGKVEVGDEQGLENEKPTFQLSIKPFYIDSEPVSVADFKLFVNLVGYQTEADKNGGGWVFDKQLQEWQWIKGANWEFPLGKGKAPAPLENPVTQITWNDAQAYATFRKKRLPTEFELEFLAKNPEKYNIKFLSKQWEWTDSWYREYGGDIYYSKRINQEKTIKLGIFLPSKESGTQFSPSRRSAVRPSESFFFLGFRCAKSHQ